MDRAYSVLEIKSFDFEQRLIEGIATTPAPDRMDDIVESTGAQFALPMPLLWQHQSGEPVGHVEAATVSDEGIRIKARIAKLDEPGELKTLTDKAWQAVRPNGNQPALVRGLSIGFRPLEVEAIKDSKNYGMRYKKWEWLELSLVTIPANMDASIQVIRSLSSAEAVAASGRKAAPVSSLPAARQSPKPAKSEGRTMATRQSIAEQISAFRETRQAKVGRMEEIMSAAADEHVTLDDKQSEEYDRLSGELLQIDEHVARLEKFDHMQKAAAIRIDGGSSTAASASRSGNGSTTLSTASALPVISTRRNLPQALAFTRYAIAIGRSRGNLLQAVEIAKNSWSDTTPEVETVLRAAVAAGTTTDAQWAGPLVVYQQMASEFIEFLRTLTIIGRIPNLRRVPFNISIPQQTTGSLAQWVGELQSKPVSRINFATVQLRWTKVANIMVLSDELVRFSNPSAEALVRDDLANGVAEFIDQQFTNPAVAEVTNVSPASITNGAPNAPASGTTAEAMRADVKQALASFSSANIPTNGLVILMRGNQAASLGMMLNPLGQPEFPQANNDGGSVFGYSIITSDSVPAGDIIFLKPQEILLADDGQVTIDASREASLQLDSAPSEPPTSMVSLFQQNAVAIRAERYINWKRRRANSVYYITGADYGGVAS